MPIDYGSSDRGKIRRRIDTRCVTILHQRGGVVDLDKKGDAARAVNRVMTEVLRRAPAEIRGVLADIAELPQCNAAELLGDHTLERINAEFQAALELIEQVARELTRTASGLERRYYARMATRARNRLEGIGE